MKKLYAKKNNALSENISTFIVLSIHSCQFLFSRGIQAKKSEQSPASK